MNASSPKYANRYSERSSSWLRRQRLRLGYSIVEIAQEVGVSERMWIHYENGIHYEFPRAIEWCMSALPFKGTSFNRAHRLAKKGEAVRRQHWPEGFQAVWNGDWFLLTPGAAPIRFPMDAEHRSACDWALA